MTKPSLTQSQKRFQESVGALFSKTEQKTLPNCLFLKSSSDVGVMRNGGRNGARFAPQAFLSTFRKFAQDHSLSQQYFAEIEVSSQEDEKADFHSSQLSESKKIAETLDQFPNARIIHIGGGHDHVYPLLTAVSRSYKKVIVINIDAHADTRTDENYHSGTPFRQFAREFAGDFELYQIGLHGFANSFSTLENLEKGKMSILWMRDFTNQSLKEFFQKIAASVSENALVLFSIDADALSGSEVPGVSAVNPSGLSRTQLLSIWNHFRSLDVKHPPVIGIYELNPLYDSLAGISMRTMASFVFETLR